LEELKESASKLTYSFGPFLLDPTERRLLRDGQELRLSPKVFDTLVLLVERHGLLVDKDELMKNLWPGMFVEEVTLARNISLLRKALGDTPGQDQSQYIETVSKRGYRFIANVTEIDPLKVQAGEPAEISVGRIAPHQSSRSWLWFQVRVLVGPPTSLRLVKRYADSTVPSFGLVGDCECFDHLRFLRIYR
jgi:DNA-binding winged helix-turn-helix (wHTH) protein